MALARIPIFQSARGDFQMVARRERDDHAGENHGHAKNFREVQPGAEPEPFDHRGEQRGEALGEQNGPAAAQPRQRLEIGGVAQADAGQPAQDKNGKRRAAGAGAQRVRPDGQKQHGAADAPEIGLHAAEPRGGAMAADGGDGEQQGGEQRGKHVGGERYFFRPGPIRPGGGAARVRRKTRPRPLRWRPRLPRRFPGGFWRCPARPSACFCPSGKPV